MNGRSKGLFVAIVALTAFLGGSPSAHACEPIIPLFHALTGATFVTASLWALGAAVFIKCAAFTYYERDLPKPKAFFFMLLANVVSTIVGFIIAGLVSANGVVFFGVPLLFVSTFWSARQLLPRLASPQLKHFSAESLTGLVTLLLIMSYVFFGVAMSLDDPPGMGYWIAKTGGLYLAIIISMVISTFYEEWIVYLLARKPKEPPTFYRAVVRANVLTLLIVMGCTAAYILPQRFASPTFTITTR